MSRAAAIVARLVEDEDAPDQNLMGKENETLDRKRLSKIRIAANNYIRWRFPNTFYTADTDKIRNAKSIDEVLAVIRARYKLDLFDQTVREGYLGPLNSFDARRILVAKLDEIKSQTNRR